MEHRTVQDYNAIFEYIFSKVIPELKCNGVVMLDFETAPYKSLRTIAPSLQLHLCRFHFAQVD